MPVLSQVEGDESRQRLRAPTPQRLRVSARTKGNKVEEVEGPPIPSSDGNASPSRDSPRRVHAHPSISWIASVPAWIVCTARLLLVSNRTPRRPGTVQKVRYSDGKSS